MGKITEINTNSSLSIAHNSASVQNNKEKGGWASTIFQTCVRPFDYLRYGIWPNQSPNETLKQIDHLSSLGLRRASVQGVSIKPITTHFQGVLDRVVHVNKTEAAVALKTAEIGPVVDFSDTEVTKPPRLQARVDATDWDKQIQILSGRLTQKISVYAALQKMYEVCGLETSTLMALVKKATEGKNPPSVWSLFISHSNPSFFQKIKAALCYLFYYKSSFITNIVDTYLGSFIQNLKQDLENSGTRSQIFSSFLKNANQFLIADIQAAKDFAFEKAKGDLEDCQNRAIEEVYDFSLKNLTKSFSETQIQRSPPIKFFKSFQKIPILNLFFQGLDWCINRLIQRTMNLRLPEILESVITTGLKATQPQNLPFSLSLTRFLTHQLEKLSLKLETGGSINSSAPVERFPGTEMLDPVIKNLKIELALQSYKTRLQLKEKFNEIEANGKKWFRTKNTEESIESGIVDAGNLLFNYLNESSGELFAQALELACDSFSSDVKDPKLLMAEYEEEQLKLQRTAKNVFREITRKAVTKKMSHPIVEDTTRLAEDSFDTQKAVTKKTIEKLSILCKKMEKKVDQSETSLSAEYNIQTEIASFLQIMQVFANRKELQEKIEGIKGVDLNTIWGVLGPLFDKIEKIQEQVLQLQELQDDYPSDASVAHHLNAIQELLSSIRDQFHERPRHLQNPFIQTLASSSEEISKYLGAKAPISIQLQKWVKQLSTLSKRISKEQKIIEALHILYPVRTTAQVKEQGLLDQLIDYERGLPPPGFRFSQCLKEIQNYLGYLPDNERDELVSLIKDGTHLQSVLPELQNTLQRIFTTHMTNKDLASEEFNKILIEGSAWTANKASKYTQIKKNDHAQMRIKISEISQELAHLNQEIQKAKISLPKSVSKWGVHILSLTLPVIGGAAGSLLGPLGTLGGAAIGGFAGKYFSPSSKNDSSKSKSTLKKVSHFVAAPIAAIGSHLYFPGVIGNTVGAGYVGWQVFKQGQSYFEKDTFNQVWDIFTNAYLLLREERIYKATATRAIKAMTKASS